MKNCSGWEIPIALWVECDGGDGVDEHLASCEACRLFAAELRESQRMLHALAEEPLPTGTIRVPRRRAWVWMWPVPAAACALWLMLLLRPLPAPLRLNVAVWKPAAPAVVRIARPTASVPRPAPRPETNFIRMETEDENVVILWIAEMEGDGK